MPFMRYKVENFASVAQPTDVNIIHSMHFACWITEASDTHSEYAILCCSKATVVCECASLLH